MYEHLNSLRKKLLELEVESPPKPWRLKTVIAVGGLVLVDFDRTNDNRAIVSHQGRGVINCLTGGFVNQLTNGVRANIINYPLRSISNSTKQNNMKIVQTTGIVRNGEIKVKLPQELSDGEVDVIVVAQNEPDEFEELRSLANTKGYDSKEKILEQIWQVKQQMLAEKGRTE